MDFNTDTIIDLMTKYRSVVLQVSLVILGAILLDFFQRWVLRRFNKTLKKTKNDWDDAFFMALGKPLSLLIFVIGMGISARIIEEAVNTVKFSGLDLIQKSLLVVVVAWFIIRFINHIEKSILSNNKNADRTTVDVVSKLLRIVVVATAFLMALQTLNVGISGVLAFGGVGGMAIGFAAKDLLANFFGGLTIYLDRPFTIGDWVRSPDRNIEGTVEKIGWRLTVIRTFDKRPLFVPNSVFTTIAVENPSRMHNRRIHETVGIRYDDAPKMDSIIIKVKEMLSNHPEIDTNQTMIVNFNSFAPSSLDFFIYTFTKTIDWVHFHEVKQDVLLKVLKIIEDEGAECAFPTSTLHLKNGEALKNIDSSR
ncbi:MAG: mechanosensitive ion channel family protein [Nitrospinales bacterium]